MRRTVVTLRLVVPALWIGMVVGLSFLETPLKFLAPGITVPLGLGIGRLVFNALSLVGGVLLVALLLLAASRPRETKTGWVLIAGAGMMLAVQALGVRPALNVRSDIVIAGGDPGGSWLHYGYIAAELLLIAIIVGSLVHASRSLETPRPLV